MRALFARVVICLLAAPACVMAAPGESKAEAERHKGILIDAAFGPSDVSLDELLAAVTFTLRQKNDDSLYDALAAFRRACGRADERRLPELVKIFGMIPAEETEKGRFFVPLGQAWLRLKVPNKLAKPPEFPEVTDGAEDSKDLPVDVRRYLAMKEALRRFSESLLPEGAIGVPPNEAGYWKLVESLLESGKGPFSNKLVKYHYSGGCMGGESFTVPQATALTMAFVADGKWAEAAASVLEVEGTDVGGSAHVLNVCVEDPQAVVLGGLAYKDSHPYFGSSTPLLALLLDLPGNGRGDGLIALAARAQGRNRALYLRALAELAREMPGDRSASTRYSTYGEENLDAARMQPLDKEGREKVKAFLCSQDVSRLSIDGAEELVRILSDSKWPEAGAALRGLLAHPSRTVAESAAKRLQEAGETVQMPPKLGPVRYRLLVDGKPYAAKRVEWSLYSGDSSKRGQAKSDADGVVEIPRDPFIGVVESERPRFGLHSLEMADIAAPWFAVQLPVPPANEDVIPVEVKTVAVRVMLPEVRSDAELAGRLIELKVRPVSWPGNLGLGFYTAAEVRTPAAREFILRLVPGEYRTEVRMPGASSWEGKIDAAKETEVKLPLTRASTVRYSFHSPKGWPEQTGSPVLMQDGKDVSSDHDSSRQVIHGLAEGKYVLHFPSSAELRHRHEYWKKQKAPDFQGADVVFEVKGDSPAEIDLGETRLK